MTNELKVGDKVKYTFHRKEYTATIKEIFLGERSGVKIAVVHGKGGDISIALSKLEAI